MVLLLSVGYYYSAETLSGDFWRRVSAETFVGNMVLIRGVIVIHNRYYTARQAPWEDSVIWYTEICWSRRSRQLTRALANPHQLSLPPLTTNLLVPYFTESSCGHLPCSIISLNIPFPASKPPYVIPLYISNYLFTRRGFEKFSNPPYTRGVFEI